MISILAMAIVSIALWWIISGTYGKPQPFPNDYAPMPWLTRGLDIFQFYPLQLFDEPDAMWGVGQQIFNLSYSNGDTTPDNLWLLPNGVQVEQNYQCPPASIDHWTYNALKSPNDIILWLDQFITINTTDNIYTNNTWPKRYTTSSPFYYMYLAMNNPPQPFWFSNTYFECNIYKLTNKMTLFPTFINDTISLPNTYNSGQVCFEGSKWSRYVKKYGTDYFYKMGRGCYYDQLFIFNPSWYQNLSSMINISQGAAYWALYVDKCELTDNQSTLAFDYSYQTEAGYEVAYYGFFNYDGAKFEWLPQQNWSQPNGAKEIYNKCMVNPWFNGAEIKSIANLLNNKYFPDVDDIDSKQRGLIQAYDEYCTCFKPGQYPYPGCNSTFV